MYHPWLFLLKATTAMAKSPKSLKWLQQKPENRQDIAFLNSTLIQHSLKNLMKNSDIEKLTA